MKTLGVDVSHWQGPINWQAFYDGGVRFATVKVSQGNYLLDPMRANHLNGAAKVGIHTGAFFWVDPIQTPEANVDKALEAIQGLPVAYLCPDLEQWWTSWASWRAWMASPATKPVPKKFDPGRLDRHSRKVMDYATSKFSGPVVPYTRASYVKDYMPNFLKYMVGRKAYLAYYLLYPKKATAMTWDTIQKALPLMWKPPLTSIGVDARMVQWSGDKIIPTGYNRVIDLDYFDGTESEMKAWLS